MKKNYLLILALLNAVILQAQITADFSVNTVNGLTVTFQNLSNYGTCNPVAEWNFDDPASGGANTSGSMNPSHTFSAGGTYNVCLTAKGDLNCFLLSDTECKFIVVSSVCESSSTISPIVCGDSYMSPSGNHIWTSSNTYMDTIFNGNVSACDSFITVNLTINSSTTAIISPVICDSSYVSPSGNYIWTSSDTYMDTIPNAANCDSIITVNLTINGVDSSVTQTGSTLTANANGAMYQWLDCDNAFAVISGETDQVFSVITNGSYAVEVSQNTCVDTSGCYTITGVGIIENKLGTSLIFYPNPISEKLYLSGHEHFGTSRFEIAIYSIDGAYQSVLYKGGAHEMPSVFKLGNIPEGMYFIMIQTDQVKLLEKVVKH